MNAAASREPSGARPSRVGGRPCPKAPRLEDVSVKITVNSKPQEVVDGISLVTLLDQLKVNRQQVAVELNAELVPRERHAACRLSEGDRLESVTLVGGG